MMVDPVIEDPSMVENTVLFAFNELTVREEVVIVEPSIVENTIPSA